MAIPRFGTRYVTFNPSYLQHFSVHSNKLHTRFVAYQCLPYTDYVMLCIKGMDIKLASFISGVSELNNERAKQFALYIRDNYKDTKLSIRWVLLKGMTDTDEEIESLASFAKELSPVFTHVELLPYHTLGKEKYDAINAIYPMGDMEPYDYDDALHIKNKLASLGVKATLAEH